uniref:Retrotransposon gag domain-containing protein n=1 Tax=Lygus hesperus TaxID=30085 RepID=A0A0A9XF90_LYGHE
MDLIGFGEQHNDETPDLYQPPQEDVVRRDSGFPVGGGDDSPNRNASNSGLPGFELVRSKMQEMMSMFDQLQMNLVGTLNSHESECNKKFQDLNREVESLKSSISSQPIPGVSTGNINDQSVSRIVQYLSQNHLNANLRLPTFSDYQNENPMLFLEELEQYFDAFPLLTDKDRLRITSTALKAVPYRWYISRKASFVTFAHFRKSFQDEFWSTEKQSDLIADLYNKTFRGDSMEIYARNLCLNLRFLEHPIPERVLVQVIIKHFHPDIQNDLLLMEINDVNTLFRKLRICDRFKARRQNHDGNDQRFYSKNSSSSFQHSKYQGANNNSNRSNNYQTHGQGSQNQQSSNQGKQGNQHNRGFNSNYANQNNSNWRERSLRDQGNRASVDVHALSVEEEQSGGINQQIDLLSGNDEPFQSLNL